MANPIHCPQCGNIVASDSAFCFHCGAKLNQFSPASQPKGGNTWIYVLIGVLLVACLGVGAWLLLSNRDGENQPAKGAPISAEAKAQAQAKERGAGVADDKAGEQTTTTTAESAEGQASSQQQASAPSQHQSSKAGVHMGLWGQIGDSNDVQFEMNGTTGFYSYQRNGQDSGRRTLRLVSYDPLSGHCIIDAFAAGKKIGQFDGTFTEMDEVDDEGEHHYGQSYNGKFNSTNGAKLDFMLYFD